MTPVGKERDFTRKMQNLEGAEICTLRIDT
jgi:hypothetical protein